jgi:transposase
MDMWKPFRLATAAHAPQAAILFDKFHVMRHLGEALDQVRKSEYGRRAGRDRRYMPPSTRRSVMSRKHSLITWDSRAIRARRIPRATDKSAEQKACLILWELQRRRPPQPVARMVYPQRA